MILYLYYVSVYIFISTGKKKVDNWGFNKKNHKELKPIKNVQIHVFIMFKNKQVTIWGQGINQPFGKGWDKQQQKK